MTDAGYGDTEPAAAAEPPPLLLPADEKEKSSCLLVPVPPGARIPPAMLAICTLSIFLSSLASLSVDRVAAKTLSALLTAENMHMPMPSP